jgi:hypothetical protein
MSRAAIVIRTPDQRLRVFVSSTLKELAPERRAVRAAIERLAMAPVMFELGARPHPPRELYRAYLEQSDIFVGVYWESTVGSRRARTCRARGRVGARARYPEARLPEAQRASQERLERCCPDPSEDDASYVAFSDAAELADLVTADLASVLAERFDAADLRQSRRALRRRGSGPRPPREALIALPSPLTPLLGRDASSRRWCGCSPSRGTGWSP